MITHFEQRCVIILLRIFFKKGECIMDKNKKQGKSSDIRGTAYVTTEKSKFPTNGVKSTKVTGGDLRVKKGGAK